MRTAGKFIKHNYSELFSTNELFNTNFERSPAILAQEYLRSVNNNLMVLGGGNILEAKELERMTIFEFYETFLSKKRYYEFMTKDKK